MNKAKYAPLEKKLLSSGRPAGRGEYYNMLVVV